MSDFSLIETMRWEPKTGFLRLDLHLARLQASARELGFAGAHMAATELARHIDTSDGPGPARRVRLELHADGRIEVTSAPFAAQPADTVWTVRIAQTRLPSTDPLLRHKISRRAVYDAARAEFTRDEADEVLLLNERGALCEGTITNIFVEDISGVLLTPPANAGLLPGVLRTSLLDARKADNAPLTPADLKGRIFHVGNSLRGLIRARLAS
jgi:4-amino-4-deoxychorismate lyase